MKEKCTSDDKKKKVAMKSRKFHDSFNMTKIIHIALG
jgi:hypothetical protein